MRHILGEDLDVGCVLSWGPCWYAQKAFFEGKTSPLSTADHLMRYDVEVSGFPSSHAGHLCLLRLKEDDYPGTTRIEQWPSWDLPVLEWGRSQGGVVGFSHSGWGLQTADLSLPNFEVPPYDGIGANEYIVDVTHGAVDFISAVDTPAPFELNIWYHTLNCGYRCKISGETDFPCIYGERVGLGRVYVKLADGVLDFDRWAQGLKDGRSYVSDGRSHLVDFRVDDVAVGEGGGELRLDGPRPVKVRAKVAAYLDAEPSAAAKAIKARPLSEKPYWDVERARVGDHPRRAAGGRRQRPTRGPSRDHRGRAVPRRRVHRADRAVELGGVTDLPVVAHEPGLRPRRRPSRPGLEGVGRVVPEGGGPVLVAEGEADPPRGA